MMNKVGPRIVGVWRFGADVLALTFWRGRFGVDVLAPRRFGANTFWRRYVLAPRHFFHSCYTKIVLNRSRSIEHKWTKFLSRLNNFLLLSIFVSWPAGRLLHIQKIVTGLWQSFKTGIWLWVNIHFNWWNFKGSYFMFPLHYHFHCNYDEEKNSGVAGKIGIFLLPPFSCNQRLKREQINRT